MIWIMMFLNKYCCRKNVDQSIFSYTVTYYRLLIIIIWQKVSSLNGKLSPSDSGIQGYIFNPTPLRFGINIHTRDSSLSFTLWLVNSFVRVIKAVSDPRGVTRGSATCLRSRDPGSVADTPKLKWRANVLRHRGEKSPRLAARTATLCLSGY